MILPPEHWFSLSFTFASVVFYFKSLLISGQQYIIKVRVFTWGRYVSQCGFLMIDINWLHFTCSVLKTMMVFNLRRQNGLWLLSSHSYLHKEPHSQTYGRIWGSEYIVMTWVSNITSFFTALTQFNLSCHLFSGLILLDKSEWYMI